MSSYRRWFVATSAVNAFAKAQTLTALSSRRLPITIRSHQRANAMSSVSLAVVGGGLVAWQVYSRTASAMVAEGATENTVSGTSPTKRKAFPAYIPSSEPDYIHVAFSPKENSFLMNNPSSDCLKAKGELRSLLKRKQWKLLRAANAEGATNVRAHLNAVRELSMLASELSDGDMIQIAQAASMRTAVGLAARCQNPDPRFFLKPPHLPEEVESSNIPHLFRKVFTAVLPPTSSSSSSLSSSTSSESGGRRDSEVGLYKNDCIRQFTNTALQTYVDQADDEAIMDYDLDNEFVRQDGLYSIPRQAYFTGNGSSRATDVAFLEYCLGVLLSHTTIRAHCERMLTSPMLPLLIRILRENSGNARIESLVGKIVANMAMFKSTHDAIWRSGLVGILSAFKSNSNLLVTLPAAKALDNLDTTYSGVKYGPGVYPMMDRRSKLDGIEGSSGSGGEVDVVFLHGLLGGLFYTWRQIDHDNSRGWDSNSDLVSTQDYSYCWPRDWFREDKMDERGVRVLGVDFDTYLSQWGGSCPKESFKTSLKERGADIYQKLRDAGVGDRKVVFVGHSMGGLIIKQMLSEAQSRDDSQFVENTRGVVFYSTPHNGSNVAKLNKTTKMIFFPTTEVQDLEPDSPALQMLHQNFTDLVKTLKMKVISFGESVKTPYLGIDLALVSPESADPECGEHHTINENHMNICKPKGKGSILYRKLSNLIWDELEEDETTSLKPSS